MRRAASRYAADRAALRCGEQQMLAIGRALISRRKLILEFSGDPAS
jgi:ABC-type branched-subunit amino acid transport system ATPase component